MRDPRRLGDQRVRVQIALGDLSDPASFRHALRGVDTVVHLAASIRDQLSGSIEELNAVATWRMVAAAERAGVERFVFFSALDATPFNRGRFFRAKALAEEAVTESGLRPHRVRPLAGVRPRRSRSSRCCDGWRCCLPVMPMSGSGRAHYQPIWADDVAAA